MASLVDTNILVYRWDPRFPDKRRVARRLLRRGFAGEALVLAHQTLVEFVAAVTRPRRDLAGAPILAIDRAQSVVEELMMQFRVTYPDERVVSTALYGVITYQLSWYDAHMWAYARVYGLDELYSEDFVHGRYYGRVRAHNPFLAAADSVHELPPMYEPEGLGEPPHPR